LQQLTSGIGDPALQGGGNPLANMGKLMESMAQAQKIVQEKTQAIQKELER
jgi:hypothetical protein